MIEPIPRAVIVAIVVTHFPALGGLHRLLAALLPQAERVVVVDNGSGDDLESWLKDAFSSSLDALEFIPLGGNLGIAAAQNVGIRRARELRAEYVLLSDQDSEPASDMIERLLAVARAKAAAGMRVAAVGPRYLDERQNNPPPFIRIRGLRVERQPCHCPQTITEVDYLIASGCLIPMQTLDTVGDMSEPLFIDYVDIEWGLRAARHGFQSYGACDAVMRHDLGDEPIEFWGRSLPLHSPLRHYYHFRNAVWLYRQGEAALHWKLADGWRLVLKYGFYTIFAKPRHLHWWMMTRGIWHGLRGRMGRLE